MAEIGKYNNLRVIKHVDFGVYLDGDAYGEILLPKRYVPENCQEDDMLDVFLYKDSEDRIIATTEKPFVQVGECAFLRVVATGTVGAFLDWGLPKDLLVPYSEQHLRMEEGKSYLVYVFRDSETDRIIASSKLDRYIDNTMPEYKSGQEVDIWISNRTDLGYKAIINNLHWGILYANEVFRPLKTGDKLKAYIKKVRPDDKIDLSLEKPGYARTDNAAANILKLLENSRDGFLPYNDKTDAELIYKIFGMSKKAFKMSIGNLYKNKLIEIKPDGIKLVKKTG